MNLSSQQPENEKEPQEPIQAAVERREQYLLEADSIHVAAAPSLGERLLPVFFAALETCWVAAIFIGLAGMNLFQSHEPLMPLWAPFVFIAGSQWLVGRLERRAASKASEEHNDTSSVTPGSSLLITLIAVVTLFMIWLSIYAQTAFIFDPNWVLALLNDILLLDTRAYHAFSIIALSCYFCWRGIRLSRREIEPAQVFNSLRLGMGVIIAVVIVRAAQTSAGVIIHDDATLLLLIPLFLFLSLAAHALARAVFERRSRPADLGDLENIIGLRAGRPGRDALAQQTAPRPVRLEGSIAAQERTILLAIGIVGLILLLMAWLVDSLASPTLLEDVHHIFVVLGAAYDWLVRVIVLVAIFLFTPIYSWLSYLYGLLFPQKAPRNVPQGQVGRQHPVPVSNTVPLIVPFVKFILPLLITLLIFALLLWALRHRRRVRIVANQRGEEVHESLWSWSLFWTQLKAFLRALFLRLFRPRTMPEEDQTPREELQGEPAARSIREIYRALLKRAASRGYPRKKNETPYEFRQRLDEQTPLAIAEPQLAVVTEAYTTTRYSGIVPGEAEVDRVRSEWAELEQKWQEA